MVANHAFISDFDGTLYHFDKKPAISNESAQAIRSYQEMGGLFGVSSARATNAIDVEARDTIDFDFYVAASGALVTNATGEVIRACHIPYDIVAWLHGRYAGAVDAVVIAADRDLYSVDGQTNHLVRYAAHLPDLPRELFGVSIACGTSKRAEEVLFEVEGAWGEMVSATKNGSGVDIVAAGCGKSSALSDVRTALGITVLGAMGDDDNDVELLAAADIGYAPNSAPPKLKDVCDVSVSKVSDAIDDFANRVTEIERILQL